MQVLVVGASGFLGAHTYELLNRARGVSVVGTYGRNPLFPDLQALDLGSAESVNDFMKSVQPDIVIWCAKHAPESSEVPLNTVGLRTLMKSAKPSMRLVFTSTDGLLLGTDGNYDESVTPVPINANFSAAVYTNAKLEAEKFISDNLDNYCIARVGPIYGESITG